jgi:hypothetical protein
MINIVIVLLMVKKIVKLVSKVLLKFFLIIDFMSVVASSPVMAGVGEVRLGEIYQVNGVVPENLKDSITFRQIGIDQDGYGIFKAKSESVNIELKIKDVTSIEDAKFHLGKIRSKLKHKSVFFDSVGEISEEQKKTNAESLFAELRKKEDAGELGIPTATTEIIEAVLRRREEEKATSQEGVRLGLLSQNNILLSAATIGTAMSENSLLDMQNKSERAAQVARDNYAEDQLRKQLIKQQEEEKRLKDQRALEEADSNDKSAFPTFSQQETRTIGKIDTSKFSMISNLIPDHVGKSSTVKKLDKPEIKEGKKPKPSTEIHQVQKSEEMKKRTSQFENLFGNIQKQQPRETLSFKAGGNNNIFRTQLDVQLQKEEFEKKILPQAATIALLARQHIPNLVSIDKKYLPALSSDSESAYQQDFDFIKKNLVLLGADHKEIGLQMIELIDNTDGDMATLGESLSDLIDRLPEEDGLKKAINQRHKIISAAMKDPTLLKEFRKTTEKIEDLLDTSVDVKNIHFFKDAIVRLKTDSNALGIDLPDTLKAINNIPIEEFVGKYREILSEDIVLDEHNERVYSNNAKDFIYNLCSEAGKGFGENAPVFRALMKTDSKLWIALKACGVILPELKDGEMLEQLNIDKIRENVYLQENGIQDANNYLAIKNLRDEIYRESGSSEEIPEKIWKMFANLTIETRVELENEYLEFDGWTKPFLLTKAQKDREEAEKAFRYSEEARIREERDRELSNRIADSVGISYPTILVRLGWEKVELPILVFEKLKGDGILIEQKNRFYGTGSFFPEDWMFADQEFIYGDYDAGNVTYADISKIRKVSQERKQSLDIYYERLKIHNIHRSNVIESIEKLEVYDEQYISKTINRLLMEQLSEKKAISEHELYYDDIIKEIDERYEKRIKKFRESIEKVGEEKYLTDRREKDLLVRAHYEQELKDLEDAIASTEKRIRDILDQPIEFACDEEHHSRKVKPERSERSERLRRAMGVVDIDESDSESEYEADIDESDSESEYEADIHNQNLIEWRGAEDSSEKYLCDFESIVHNIIPQSQLIMDSKDIESILINDRIRQGAEEIQLCKKILDEAKGVDYNNLLVESRIEYLRDKLEQHKIRGDLVESLVKAYRTRFDDIDKVAKVKKEAQNDKDHKVLLLELDALKKLKLVTKRGEGNVFFEEQNPFSISLSKIDTTIESKKILQVKDFYGELEVFEDRNHSSAIASIENITHHMHIIDNRISDTASDMININHEIVGNKIIDLVPTSFSSEVVGSEDRAVPVGGKSLDTIAPAWYGSESVKQNNMSGENQGIITLKQPSGISSKSIEDAEVAVPRGANPNEVDDPRKKESEKASGAASGSEDNLMPMPRTGIWAKVSGGKSKQLQDESKRAFDMGQVAVTGGFDFTFAENIVIGAAFGHSQMNIAHESARNEDSQINTNTMSLYSAVRLKDRLLLSGQVGKASFTGVKVAGKDMGFLSKFTSTSLKYGVHIGKGFIIAPKIGVDFVNIISKIDETKDDNTLSCSFGCALSKKFKLGSGGLFLIPEVRAGVALVLNGKERQMNLMRLISNNPDKGVKHMFGASFKIEGTDRLELDAGFDYIYWKKFRSHQGYFQVKLKF